MNVNILDVYDFFYFTIIRNFLKLFFFLRISLIRLKMLLIYLLMIYITLLYYNDGENQRTKGFSLS